MTVLGFEPNLSKTNSHVQTVHSFPLKKTASMPEKLFLKKDVMQIMLTSVKGKHFINAEMNAESLEYDYFP